MSAITRYAHASNLIGVATGAIVHADFNDRPVPLHVAGTREAAASLFHQLESTPDLEACGHLFQDYMCVVFGFDSEQRLREDAFGRRRFRSSYLRLIQDWGLDSNNAQGAVLKGWVESRFGLLPIFHKQRIHNFMGKCWWDYVEEKMNSRYHNNCIYMQLDLLYEFCQWVIGRFQVPAATHKMLYRGVDHLDEWATGNEGKREMTYRFNSIVSFTDDPSVADGFGRYVLKVNVPMVKLVFFTDLLPHHALRGESEYLVLGGNYRVQVIS